MAAKSIPANPVNLVRYSKMKQASKSNNNAVAAATSLSPAQCKSQSFLRALFAARVCAVLTLLSISVNWAIGCLKWIAAAAFLLPPPPLTRVLIPPCYFG